MRVCPNCHHHYEDANDVGLLKYANITHILQKEELEKPVIGKIVMHYYDKHKNQETYKYNIQTFCEKYNIEEQEVVLAAANNYEYMKVGNKIYLQTPQDGLYEIGKYTELKRSN